MEALMHNDYRQQPITSDEACDRYRAYLARLEAMIENQEDVVLRTRTAGDARQLGRERTSLWRLLTKRQGVVDVIAAYERGQRVQHSA
ncbi:MAG: hypothetical protein ACRDHP_03335 [Ktedonobacterales bacterium]